ncbi:MAG TPA: hypothetical protein VLE53_16840 [Gemmatimonadaceae bacterium]|nr:hypothetical protein [Gemmatimonadaceae bacterium]
MSPLSAVLSLAVLPFRRVAAACAALLALGLASCDGLGPVGPEPNQLAAVGGTDTSADPNVALVGTWHRTVLFVDEFGNSRAIETTWRFAGDGSAVRTIVTTNLTLQTSEVEVVQARWRIQEGAIVLEFTDPLSAPIFVDFVIIGDELILGGELFTRIT